MKLPNQLFFVTCCYTLVFNLVVCRISNERRCADPECSIPISKAHAILRYNADDERLLSFHPNDKATVYSKEAGDNPSLWEVEEDSSNKCVLKHQFGSLEMFLELCQSVINGKRGYVPKTFVREDKVLVKSSKVNVIVTTGRDENRKQNLTQINVEQANTKPPDLFVTPELPLPNSKGIFSMIGGVSADSVPPNSPDIKPQSTKAYQVFDGTTIYGEPVSETPEVASKVTSDAKTPSSITDGLDSGETKNIEEKLEESPSGSVHTNVETKQTTEKVKSESAEETSKIEKKILERDMKESPPVQVDSTPTDSILHNLMNSVSNFISSGTGEKENEEEEEEEYEDEEGSGEEETSNEDEMSLTEEEFQANETITSADSSIETTENEVKVSTEKPAAIVDEVNYHLDNGSESIPVAPDLLGLMNQNRGIDINKFDKSHDEEQFVNDSLPTKVPDDSEQNPTVNINSPESNGTEINTTADSTGEIKQSDFSRPIFLSEETADGKELSGGTHSENNLNLSELPEEEKAVNLNNSQESIIEPSAKSQPLPHFFQSQQTEIQTDLEKDSKVDNPVTTETAINESSETLVVSKSKGGLVKTDGTVKPVTEETEAVTKPPEMEQTTPRETLFGRGQVSISSETTEQPSSDTVSPTKQPSSDIGPPTEQPSSDIVPPTEQPSSDIVSPTEQPSSDIVPPTEQPSSDIVPPTEQPSSDNVSPTDQPSFVGVPPEPERSKEIAAQDVSSPSNASTLPFDILQESIELSNQLSATEESLDTLDDTIIEKGDKEIVEETKWKDAAEFSETTVDDVFLHQQEIAEEAKEEVSDVESPLVPSEEVITETKVVEDSKSTPEPDIPSDWIFSSWLKQVFSHFGSSDPNQIDSGAEPALPKNLDLKGIKGDSCLADSSAEEACDTLKDVPQANDVTWQDSVYSSDMSSPLDLLDRIPLEATIWLIVTAVVVLIFSLGHYYIEAHRRDGPLVAVINKLEREVLILKKESCILEDRLNTAQQQVEAWNTNSSESDALIVELKQELEETKTVKAELEEQVAVLEREVETVTESGMEMHRLLEESLSSQDGSQVLLSTVQSLREKLEHQEDEIVGLSQALTNKNVEVEELQEKLAQSAEAARGLEDRIIALTREKDEEGLHFKDKHRQLMAQLEEVMETRALDETRVSTEMSKLRLSIEELQKNLAEKDLELEAVKEVVKQLRSTDSNEKMDALFDVVGIQARLKAAVTERNDFREKFQEEEGARKLLEGHMKKITQEVAELKNSFETAEKEKIEALTKLQVLSNYFKEKESQLQKELGTQESMWLQKQSDDHTIYEQMRSLREENEKYKLQNESLKKEIVEQESSFKIQLANVEQKSHEHWVTSRQTERKLKEAQQEAAQLRNRLTVEKSSGNYSLDDSKQNISESNGDPSSPPPSLMFPPTASPPFMLYSMPPPGDFIPPPPLMGSPYPPDSRPPPLGRISSPPLDHRFSPPPPLPYPPYDYSPYGHHSPSPPPPLPHHRTVHKPQPREMSREQKDHVMSSYSPETDKTIRRNKR